MRQYYIVKTKKKQRKYLKICMGFIPTRKKDCFWIVYKSLPKKEKKEFMRWNFWAWMMDHLPRIYWWCDKHLKCDTLPF